MDDNTRDDAYPFNTPDTAMTAISLPTETNPDDEIVPFFRQSSSRLYLSHNPPTVSLQLAESYPPTRPRHHLHHYLSGVGAATVLPEPRTQGSAGIPLQPPFGQGLPAFRTEEMRAGTHRLPSPSPRQPPECPPLSPQHSGRQRRGSEAEAPLPHDTRERNTERLTNAYFAWNTYWQK